jgi:hypothetical protein
MLSQETAQDDERRRCRDEGRSDRGAVRDRTVEHQLARRRRVRLLDGLARKQRDALGRPSIRRGLSPWLRSRYTLCAQGMQAHKTRVLVFCKKTDAGDARISRCFSVLNIWRTVHSLVILGTRTSRRPDAFRRQMLHSSREMSPQSPRRLEKRCGREPPSARTLR